MNPYSPLRQLQMGFKAAVAGETGFSSLTWIREAPPLSASERLGIYRYAYGSRITGVLEHDFNFLARMAGKERFSKLMMRFLKAHPSKSHTLTDIGRFLPHFLEKHAKELSIDPAWIEMARFEWAMHVALFTDEKPRAGLEKIPTAGERDWSMARFILHPAASLHAFENNILELYEDEKSAIRARETFALVSQCDQAAVYEEISEQAFRFLSALEKKTTLEEATRAIGDTGLDDPELFSRWLQDGTFHSIEWNDR